MRANPSELVFTVQGFILLNEVLLEVTNSIHPSLIQPALI
eukprot:UN24659